MPRAVARRDRLLGTPRDRALITSVHAKLEPGRQLAADSCGADLGANNLETRRLLGGRSSDVLSCYVTKMPQVGAA